MNVQKAENNTVYQLSTPKGAILGLFVTIVTSTVTLKEHSMDISMHPKRMNKIPAISYDDIISTEVKNAFSWYYAALAILGCFTVVIPILCIWLGRFRKINIKLKNGMSTSLYCRISDKTDEFYSDLKSRIDTTTNHQINISCTDQ